MAEVIPFEPQALLTELREAAPEMARDIAGILRAHAPVDTSPEPSRPPGIFRDSLQGQSELSGDGVLLEVVSNDEPVVDFIMKGTAPHVIERKAARALRFTVAGGEVVYSVRVNHPGTKPSDFVEQAEPEIERYLEERLDRVPVPA